MKTRIKVTYWLEDGHWMGRAVATPRRTAHTYGRTLEQVKERMLEAVELLVETPRSTWTLVETVKLPSAVKRAVAARASAEKRARAAALEATRASASAARSLVQLGLSLRDAGTILGISRQRTEQVLKGTLSLDA